MTLLRLRLPRTSALVACALLSAVLAAAATPPIKALLVTGGCSHDFEAQKKILSEGIGARANVVFDIVHEGTERTHRMSIYEKADVVPAPADSSAFPQNLNPNSRPHDSLPPLPSRCP